MSTSAGCGAARRCRGTRTFAGPVALLLALLASLSFGARANAAPEEEGIHKIQHVVMIMQENRSFDSYFGTYPGANGIPVGHLRAGPDQRRLRPRPSTTPPTRTAAARTAPKRRPPTSTAAAWTASSNRRRAARKLKCTGTNPECSCVQRRTEEGGETPPQGNCIDVMGYHDAREIPNYWTYAQNFVLQDNMFESAASWSLPGAPATWSPAGRRTASKGDTNPLDCENSLDPRLPARRGAGRSSPAKRRTPGPTSPTCCTRPT